MKKCSSRQGFISVFLSMALLYGSSVTGVEKGDSDNAVLTKLTFFSWLVEDSPTMERIMQSADSEAIAQLEKSRQLLQQAQAHYEAGEYLMAEKHIATGIKEVGSVARKVKDADKVGRAHKKLFHELKQHVQTFSDVFERVAKEKNDTVINAMLDREKLQKMMDEADVHYRDGQLELAIEHMKLATGMVEVAISNARHNDVLIHELSFDSPEDEYQYEKKRNQSYVMLIRLLQEKQTVSDASRQYVNKIVVANKGVVEEAEMYAAKGDSETAIKVLEKATDKLSRALRMAGAPL